MIARDGAGARRRGEGIATAGFTDRGEQVTPGSTADQDVHDRVCARIRALCRVQGITLTQLIERAHVSASHFWGVMNGGKSPTIEWLQQIAVALGVDIEDLCKRP